MGHCPKETKPVLDHFTGEYIFNIMINEVLLSIPYAHLGFLHSGWPTHTHVTVLLWTVIKLPIPIHIAYKNTHTKINTLLHKVSKIHMFN